MAGSHRRRSRKDWYTVAALACPAPTSPPGTPAGPQPHPTDGYDRQSLLISTADGAVLPTYEAFVLAAESLEDAALAWSVELEAGAEGSAARDEARTAWRVGMLAWQRAEAMLLGPAGAPGNVVGGLGLRDEIYSWPTVNPCLVDQELVAEQWDEPDYFAANLVNVYGLDALEHLLFVVGPDNACPVQVPINQEGTWDALGESEVDRRRAAFAAVLASGVAGRAHELVEAWSPEGADFRGTLAAAGEDGSAFVDLTQAMDELFAALFYLDLDLKDRKLAQPLGLLDCSTPTCPEALESPLADHALPNMRANLEGGRLLYRGGDDEEDVGLDDFVVYVGEPEIDQAIEDAFAASLAAIDAVPNSATTQLAEDPAPLLALHGELQVLTDLIESDLATLLLLQVPQEAADDND